MNWYSGYPMMSRTEWENAPWNEVRGEYEICDECKGNGGVYYNEDGDEITPSEYEMLSEVDKSLWEYEECSKCKGEGRIEIEPMTQRELEEEFFDWYYED